MRKFFTLVIAAFLAINFGAKAQTNLLAGWDANLLGYQQTNIANTEANKWGWASTFSTATWGTANGSGVRFMDVTSSSSPVHYNADGTVAFVGREFLYRWDGSYWGATLSLGKGDGTTTTVTPITLSACTSYTLSGLYEWWANGSQPTYSFSVSTAQTGGTIIATGSYSYPSATKNRLQSFSLTFTCPTTGAYYIQVKQTNGTGSGNGTLIGIANLSMTQNSSQTLNVNNSSFAFSPSVLSKTFTVIGNALTSDVTLTAPAGITLDKTTIPAADAQCGVTVTATFDNATAISNDTIRITSGTLTQKIAVSSSVSSASCFTPLYSDRTNQVPDAYCSDLSGFGGWGIKSIVYGVDSYCGNSCVKFAGTTNTYPNGAALDKSGYAWAANSAYRVKFMYKTVDGTLGFMANGANPNFSFSIPQTTDQWATIDTVFTTGAAPTTGFFSINNVDASATGKIAYIDNYELYDITNIDARLKSLTLDAGSLSPAFAPSITNYSVSLPTGTTSVTPTVAAEVAAAAISGNGTVDVTSGSGASTIQVTATDGLTTKTYHINYVVGVPTGIQTPTQKMTVTVAGDVVKVQGTLAGDDVKVYSVNGQLIQSVVAASDVTSLNLKSGVYVIKVNDKVLKVVK